MAQVETEKQSPSVRQRVFMLVLSVVALVALLTSVTFSWFIVDHTVISHPVDVSIKNAPYLMVGTMTGDELSWHPRLELKSVSTVTPVCGDGTTFYGKNLTYFNTAALTDKFVDAADHELYAYTMPDTLTELSAAEKQVNVCFENFDLQANYPGQLYLADESTLNPAFDASPMSPEIPGVSTGYIAGALRMAIFQMDSAGEYQLKCIWIPNARYEYDALHNSFTETGKFEKSYSFYSSDGGTGYTVTTVTTADYPAGYAKVDGVLYVWDLSRCNQPFATYTGGNDGKIRIAIWLDGFDRECVNALAGGKVDLSLGIHITTGLE